MIGRTIIIAGAAAAIIGAASACTPPPAIGTPALQRASLPACGAYVLTLDDAMPACDPGAFYVDGMRYATRWDVRQTSAGLSTDDPRFSRLVDECNDAGGEPVAHLSLADGATVPTIVAEFDCEDVDY